MLPMNLYFKARGNRDGHDTTCKHCRAEQKHRRSITGERRARQYNLSVRELNLMLERGCYICGGYERLCIDHDHTCCPKNQGSCGQCIRGVLCDDCNKCLGIMKDDINRLTKAAEYLRKSKLG